MLSEYFLAGLAIWYFLAAIFRLILVSFKFNQIIDFNLCRLQNVPYF